MTVQQSHSALDDASDEAVPAAPGARTLIVTDERAADALTNPTSLRHLAPFLGRVSSVSAAARESGEKPNTTLRRVHRFASLGLVEVAATEPRAGRPIKLYRSTADVFFVPFEVTHSESLEAALAERDHYWERMLRRNVVRGRREALGEWGTRFYRDRKGRLQVQTAVTPDANATTLDPGAPATLSLWRDQLQLDFADAKELQREMFALVQRYQRKSGAQRYLVRMGLAPILGDDA
ncbi:MAG: ArsR family transcriptional regulator [Trueperaceae bacterium]|nr:ArsR family transcriptional regulator [Trueperaceae bacterium]